MRSASVLLLVGAGGLTGFDQLKVGVRDLPLLAVIGIAAGAIVDLPWEMSIFVGLAYLASIPVLYWRRAKLRGRAGSEVHAVEEVDDMA